MIVSRQHFIHTTLLILVLTLFGCGNSAPPLSAVSGEVLEKGAPVEGAQVTFINQDPQGLPATAVTDASGKFTLATYWNPSKTSLAGAMPGNYQITISKTVEPTQAEKDKAMAESRSLKRAQLLPEKYASPKTSGLTFEVKPTGPNEFKIDVD